MTESRLAPDHPDAVVGGEPRLPKPPGVIRQFWARHPRSPTACSPGSTACRRSSARSSTAVAARAPGLADRHAGGRGGWRRRIGAAAVPANASAGSCSGSPGSRASCPRRPGRSTRSRSCSPCTRSPCTSSTRAAWIGFGTSVAVGAFAAYLSTVAAKLPLIVEPFEFDAVRLVDRVRRVHAHRDAHRRDRRQPTPIPRRAHRTCARPRARTRPAGAARRRAGALANRARDARHRLARPHRHDHARRGIRRDSRA